MKFSGDIILMRNGKKKRKRKARGIENLHGRPLSIKSSKTDRSSPDVQIIYISKKTATAKFPIVVREELVAYLKELAQPKTAAGLSPGVYFNETIEKEGIEPVGRPLGRK